MLQTKAFKMSDDKGVNELLKTSLLAEGASIFVSNGEILVPYEDGEPRNNEQLVIAAKVQINSMSDKQAIHRHTVRVANLMTAKLKERLTEREADLAELESKQNSKNLKRQVTEMQGNIQALRDQIRANEIQNIQLGFEIDRLETEKQLFVAEIEELTK